MRNNSGMGKKEVKSTTFDQEIYFWHNWTVCLRSAMENSTCLFLAIVGGHCGSDTKYRTRSVEMVPLLSCNWDILRHKSFFSIIGIENEAEFYWWERQSLHHHEMYKIGLYYVLNIMHLWVSAGNTVLLCAPYQWTYQSTMQCLIKSRKQREDRVHLDLPCR